jgi:hypothetical protein
MSTDCVSSESSTVLPTPVAQYFRRVLRDGQPLIKTARFTQAGQLRTSLRSERWMPFTATQTVHPQSVSFVWDAKVRVIPFLHVDVRDAYVSNEAHAVVRLMSFFTVADDRGGAKLNEGELYRFLAEGFWFPTAWLPRDGLVWSAIDDGKALVTLTHAGITVSIEVRFNHRAEVTSIYAKGRPFKRPDGGFDVLPWEGRVYRYEERDGIQVPIEADVGWYVNGIWTPVWRGAMTSMTYEFVARA